MKKNYTTTKRSSLFIFHTQTYSLSPPPLPPTPPPPPPPGGRGRRPPLVISGSCYMWGSRCLLPSKIHKNCFRISSMQYSTRDIRAYFPTAYSIVYLSFTYPSKDTSVGSSPKAVHTQPHPSTLWLLLLLLLLCNTTHLWCTVHPPNNRVICHITTSSSAKTQSK